MNNRMLSLPSMLFLLAFGMVLSVSAGTTHADELANQTAKVADEASTVVSTSQAAADQTQSQEKETSPAMEEDTSNLSLKPNAQQESQSPDSSTELQDPAEQTPPETSDASAPATTSADSVEKYAQDATQNQSSTSNGPGVIRATSAQVTATRSVVSSQSGDAIVDLSADKASYRQGEDVNLSVDFKNTTDKEQDVTVYADVYYIDNKLGTYKFSKHLKAGEGYKMQSGDLKIPASQFENNYGYLLKVRVADADNNTLSEVNKAIAVESDWTKFPRYGIVGGSQDTNNSLLSKDADRYRAEIEKMKNMNINSYFFYDVYKTATNPFPSDEATFKQDWNTWSGSEIDTQAVKDIVNQVHDGGAVAMLYNMILAENTNTGEAPVLPETEYAYNSDDRGYGAQGQPMSYTVKIPKDGQEEDVEIQRYYNPTSKLWQDYIADKMGQAMKNGGFDGWQGDTIGDNEVYSYADKDSNDPSKKFWLTEGYAEFLRAIKEKLPNYYLTVNDVNGEQIYRLKDGNQDVIYNEIWPFGGSALGDGRSQTEYGDLKARVDEVRKVTGKSLIVGAYMEGSENGGSKADAEAGKSLQTDAVLLTSASIAAAGGYHMSLAALANQQDETDGGQGIGVLQTAYYPTQSLKTSSELTRKNNDYQQFITAYENVLRDGVENDDAQVNTFDSNGQKLSTDAKGITGNQVWTYGKKGDNFRTVQLLNLMGINSDWKNEDGSAANKTPDEQTNLTVKYALGDVSMEDAQRMANQTYVTSPDDWSKSNLQKVSASVKTDENGKPVLVINVPKLTLWDVVYISNADQESAPEADQAQTPAAQSSDDKVAENETSQPAAEDAKEQTSEPAQDQAAPAEQGQAINQAESPATEPEAEVTPATAEPAKVDAPEANQAADQAVSPEPASQEQAASQSQPEANQTPASNETPATQENSEQPELNEPPAQTQPSSQVSPANTSVTPVAERPTNQGQAADKADQAPTNSTSTPESTSPVEPAATDQSSDTPIVPAGNLSVQPAEIETPTVPDKQGDSKANQSPTETPVADQVPAVAEQPQATEPNQAKPSVDKAAAPEAAKPDSTQAADTSNPAKEADDPEVDETKSEVTPDSGTDKAPEAGQVDSDKAPTVKPSTPENNDNQPNNANDADKNKTNEADSNKANQDSTKGSSTDQSGKSTTPEDGPDNSGPEDPETKPSNPNTDTSDQEQVKPSLPVVPNQTVDDPKTDDTDTPANTDSAKSKKVADADKNKVATDSEGRQKSSEFPKEATDLEKVGQPASPQVAGVKSSVATSPEKKSEPVSKTSTTSSSDKLPKTGDHKTVVLIIVLGLAFVGMTGLLARHEKK